MNEREQVLVTLLSLSGYNADELNGPLKNTIAILQNHLDSVPDEFKDKVEFCIDVDSDYDGGYSIDVSIDYHRPETDLEMNERIQRKRLKEAQWRARNEAQERAAYEALKRKYG